jgi:phasin family protein
MARVFGANGANVTAFIEAGEALLKGMIAINQEVMNFTNQRMRADVEVGQSMARCTDPVAAFDLQCEFARSATEQYLAETTKLMQLATKMTMASLTPLQVRAKVALDEMGAEGAEPRA